MVLNVMELFQLPGDSDGSRVPRERDQARTGGVKGIFVNFHPLKYLRTYF